MITTRMTAYAAACSTLASERGLASDHVARAIYEGAGTLFAAGQTEHDACWHSAIIALRAIGAETDPAAPGRGIAAIAMAAMNDAAPRAAYIDEL